MKNQKGSSTTTKSKQQVDSTKITLNIWTNEDAIRDSIITDNIQKASNLRSLSPEQRDELQTYILAVSETMAFALEVFHKHTKGALKDEVEEAMEAARLTHEKMMEITE
jgi:glyceraldehyde-3-phosphate dehydrogenase/erythrose-4-phosphate dehydrogenase